jgi:hypothetical protein
MESKHSQERITIAIVNPLLIAFLRPGMFAPSASAITYLSMLCIDSTVACTWRSASLTHRARSRRELPWYRLDRLLLDCCRLLHRLDRLLPAFLRHPSTSVLESTRPAAVLDCVHVGKPLEPA